MTKIKGGASQQFFTRYETVLTLIVYFASYPVLYLVNVLLSRALGPANYGDYAVTRSVAILAATLALLGLDKATLAMLPVYRKENQTESARGFVSFALIAVLVTGIVISLIGTAIVLIVRQRMPDLEHPVMISMLWVIPMSIGFYFVSLLASHQQILLSSFLSRLVLPLFITLLLGGIYLAGLTLTDFRAVGLLIVARIGLIAILLWLLWSIWRRNYSHTTPVFERKRWLVSTLPFLLPSLVLTAQGQSATLILEAHHPSEASVGLFAAVQQVAYFPLLALAAISVLAMPRLAVLIKEEETDTLNIQLGTFLRILTAFGIGALLAFILFGDQLLSLFGDGYQDGHLPLVILGVGYLIALIGGLLIPILQVKEESTIVISTMVALLAVNVGLTYLLAPRYGALGASIAYTIAVAVIYAIQLVLFSRVTDIAYLRSIINFGSASSPANRSR